MRERFRSFDSKISFFAFADIITAVSGMLIFITLLLATDLGHPTDNRSSAAEAKMEKQLQETLRQQAQADAENRGLQQLLTTANTAPAADKLESDIARLRAELTDEKSKHAGLAEELAASKSALEERDKVLGITAVRQQIQDGVGKLAALAREDEKVRDETTALEQKIKGVEAKIVKLRSREGQIWLMPDRSQTTKEPILVVVSGKGVEVERFNRPELGQRFDKSGARAGFEAYLNRSKEAQQYFVFLIRPSGIAIFKDLEKMTRKKNFEMGFDALEEDREIHFTAPPPLDDEEVSGKKPDRMTGPPGTPSSMANARGSGGTDTTEGPSGVPTAGPPTDGGSGTNMTSGSGATNGIDTASGTNALSGTNGTSEIGAMSGTNTVSGTNTTASPPPPPKPKSWWQRFLEWIGIK
ncbi:MAG TPA: hypothetical protein VH597_16760 [Verrucomicrobiae bacterium]|jgi:hypothetical protein|nr:hypothetical protein [Verrucomicrobiae bacterium]